MSELMATEKQESYLLTLWNRANHGHARYLSETDLRTRNLTRAQATALIDELEEKLARPADAETAETAPSGPLSAEDILSLIGRKVLLRTVRQPDGIVCWVKSIERNVETDDLRLNLWKVDTGKSGYTYAASVQGFTLL